MRDLDNVDAVLSRLIEDNVVTYRPNPQIRTEFWTLLSDERIPSQQLKAVKESLAQARCSLGTLSFSGDESRDPLEIFPSGRG